MTQSIILIVPMVALTSIFRLAGYVTEPRLSNAEIHAIAGEPVRLTSTSIGRPLRIVTWNIARGVRLQKIVTTLKALEPDIVLLQEVDRYCKRSGSLDVARELGRLLEMNWVSAGEFQEIGEAKGTVAAITGQAILSRDAITDASVIVFANQSSMRWRLNPLQPRRGGRIALRARTAGVLVYSLHLESVGGDHQRSSQLKDVLSDQSWQRAAVSSALRTRRITIRSSRRSHGDGRYQLRILSGYHATREPAVRADRTARPSGSLQPRRPRALSHTTGHRLRCERGFVVRPCRATGVRQTFRVAARSERRAS